MTKPLKDKEGQSSRRRAASPPPRHHATRSRRKLQPQAEEEVPGPAQNALTQDALPRDALPRDALPQDALPQDALPQDALPLDPLPQDALPLDPLPLDPLPQDPLPQDPLPQDPWPQDPLIHQLQTAFTKIGKETVALELQNLTAHSQEILVATIQASLRKIAKDDDKSTTFRIESDASSPRTIPGGLHDLEKLYHEEKAKMMADMLALRQKTENLQSQLDLANRQSPETKSIADRLRKYNHDGDVESSIHRTFTSMRTQLFGLSVSSIYFHSGNLTCSYVAVPSEDDVFYLAWFAASKEDRRSLIRARMFQFLHDRILNREMFGVATIAAASGAERRIFRDLEECLGQLERSLQARRVAENDIADLRMATLKCVQSCQRDDNFSDDLATTMYAIFERLIIKDGDSEDIERAKKGFSQLCRDAVKIRLLMRGSDANYRCGILRTGFPFNPDIADIMAVWNNKTTDNCLHIMLTLFGALFKRPQGSAEEVVLEKAWVAIERERG